MKLQIRSSVLVLTCALVAIGCASKPEFDASELYDPLARFPVTATFAWNDNANRAPENPELQQLNYGSVLKRVANEEFAKRGYSNVAPGSNDYWLSYELTVHSWFSAERTQATGTLSLSLVDANSKRRVWLGYGRAEVLVGLNEEERAERSREILAAMLEKFPPNQQGK
jgi:hypothetical protein